MQIAVTARGSTESQQYNDAFNYIRGFYSQNQFGLALAKITHDQFLENKSFEWLQTRLKTTDDIKQITPLARVK